MNEDFQIDGQISAFGIFDKSQRRVHILAGSLETSEHSHRLRGKSDVAEPPESMRSPMP
jgi:hypothetical protein